MGKTSLLVETPRVELYKMAKVIASNNPIHSKLPVAFKEACLSTPTKSLANMTIESVEVKKYNIIAGNIEKLHASIKAVNNEDKVNLEQTGT